MLGSYITPYTNAPDDFDENGIPYGAFCKCVKCEYVGRSSNSFDYYADDPGGELTCESCKGGQPKALEAAMRDKIEPDNPEFK